MSLGYQYTFNPSAIVIIAATEPTVPPVIPSISLSSRNYMSVGIRLEHIYAQLAGHTAPKAERSEYWLLERIGQELGLNLISGYRSREDHFIAMHNELTGNTYNGSKSVEAILNALEEAL